MKKLNTVISSRINRSLVLTEIKRNPNISRVQLADKTSLDRSAITQILNYLIEEGLVEEVEKGKPGSKGGRCPIFLQVRYDSHTVIAVEVGLDFMEGVIADLRGHELHRKRQGLQRGEPLLEALTRLLDQFARDLPDAFAKAVVIGICAPGVVDSEAGILRANMYHKWREVMVVEALSELYRKEVFLENDANVGAMGELFRLGPSGVQSILYLFLRDSEGEAPLGVGGALVLEGRVWRGSHHFAGESSVTINSSFQRIISEHGLKGKRGKSDHRKNLQSLLEFARGGDSAAIEARDEMADRLGLLLSELALFVDPNAVMVSISPWDATRDFWEQIRRSYESHVAPNDRHIRFLEPLERDKAPLEGLVALGLDRVFVTDSSTASILFSGSMT
jgi:predicted NBD/HSP70 family sugar kinase/ribosomal protein S25